MNAPQRNTFEVTPSAHSVFLQYQQRFSHLLAEILEDAERNGYCADERQLRDIEGRMDLALSYFSGRLKQVFTWLFHSRETTNFTYDLTPHCLSYMSAAISVVTGVSTATIKEYFDELRCDDELRNHVQEVTLRSEWAHQADAVARYGRRIGWYAFARATKAKVIVETGVEKGLGSCVLAAAVRRNREEGYESYYYGTDIDRNAGFLFCGNLTNFGEIRYGDSIESLKKLDRQIDLFVNDSDHSAEYEAREYQIIEHMLSERGIILGDNAHVTDCLVEFAERTGRRFLFVPERPHDHWYPGCGIGVAFR